MKNNSVYGPENRKRLLDSMVGHSIIEIRRYYSQTVNIEDKSANEIQYFRKHGEVISIHLSNDLIVDISYYLPYIEVRRSLKSGIKYLLTPDELMRRRISIIYRFQNFTTTHSKEIGSYFESVFNMPIASVSVIVESNRGSEVGNEKSKRPAKGIIVHFREWQLIVGLGVGVAEYYLGVTVDKNSVVHNFNEVELEEVEQPIDLQKYIKGDSEFGECFYIELNDFKDWVWDGSGFYDFCKTKKLSISRLIEQLVDIESILIEYEIGILDLNFVVDASENGIFIDQPFDVVSRRLAENDKFIKSIVAVFESFNV